MATRTKPASDEQANDPAALQRKTLMEESGEDTVLARLVIDCSDADGVRFFDEALPFSVLRAILNPAIDNFFLPIQGSARQKPPRSKQHYLHTQYIREIILLEDLPEEGN